MLRSVLTLAAACVLAFPASATTTPPPTVANFSVPAYMGMWYQIADYIQPYEILCKKCTTAHYAANADGSITVVNKATGYVTCNTKALATVDNPEAPGKLTVAFYNGLFHGQYWIVKIGPVDPSTGKYTWAIVSNEKRSSLYLLHRRALLSSAEQDALVNETAALGFDLNKLTYTPHGHEHCPSEPAEFSLAQTLLGDDTVTLYKVSGDECGQATLASKYASYAEKFAGLSEGTCSAKGYTVADGTQTLKVPVLGTVVVSKFKKPTVTLLGDSMVTLYKVSGDECGQATLASKYASYAEKFAGLSEGTCSAKGYTVASGTQTLKVPVLGTVVVSKFKKPTILEM